jgi:pimeloyl-ACP methyl ester carboxylesterase
MFALGLGAAAMAGTAGTSAAESEVDIAGFRGFFAQVNGIRLHYMAGGRGEPLVLLPGWPQTWWEYRKVLPTLATRFRVIAVDLRGMGDSERPATGFDKKTIAADIAALVRRLGYAGVNIAGHDIGSMVAHSFAVNHPDLTRRVALMDVPHPDQTFYTLPLLPHPGEFSPWWFSFNQVHELPEQLLAGRAHLLTDWIFDHLLLDPGAIAPRDRAVFARAYDTSDAIRAGNAWYQAFPQDIADMAGYGKITAPFLGLATEATFDFLQLLWPTQATDAHVIKVPNTGHFLLEEQPGPTSRLLLDFFA